MMQAYILMKVETGRDKEVLAEMAKLSEIRRGNSTYGIYDLIIEVELPTIEELDEFVFNKIRKVPGVRETNTVIISTKF